MSIKFENGENIKLWSNEGIINDCSLNYSGKVEEYKYYIDEYKNILKDINYFYEIEKQFIDNLNKKENESSLKSGYLIKNSWVDNWKKITNYEKIKTLIKLNNRNDIISDEIINHLEKNKLNYKDLPPGVGESRKFHEAWTRYHSKKPSIIANNIQNFIKNFFIRTGSK